MLLNFEHVKKSYGDRLLLDDVTFYLTPGERMGVLGVNGCGKSTLIQIAAGREEPDSGKVSTDPNVCISYLPQIPEDDPQLTALSQVLSGCPSDRREVFQYEAETILTRLGIEDFNKKICELSGGQRKRVALAECLVTPADILILDEPTNHLDFAMIRWLEEYLENFSGAVLFVTHDRYFLEHVATKTADLSFGKLYICDGGYSSWLDYKSRREEMAAASERKRQSVLRRELIWILQGPCARGTKSRERLERYASLKAQLPPQTEGELSEIRTVSSRLGKTTIELADVSKRYGEENVILPFSYVLKRDDRIGIIGLNGSGKTTLLNLITGSIQPDSGNVLIGETVNIGYFTQHSDAFDLNQTALEYVKERGEKIQTQDGFLSAGKLMEMFLFPAELQYRQVSKLSGGEKRRLFLLGILAFSPNVLVLDEPTNDLDIPTLRILENYLLSFPGAVIAVSHDRYFLDRICSEVFVLRKGESIRRYTGGYTDFVEMLSVEENTGSDKKKQDHAAGKPVREPPARKLKFSFKEQREFETIDADIDDLEARLKENAAEQEKYSTDYVRLQELAEKQQILESELEEKMERWVYLNDLAERIEKERSNT